MSTSFKIQNFHRIGALFYGMSIPQFRLSLALLFVFCTVTGISQNLDINILKGINPDVPNSGVWRAFSSSVSPVVIGLPVGLYLVGQLKHNEDGKANALHIAGAILTSMAITQAIKYTIDRDRPFITYPLDVHPYDNSETGLSFPSQHTSFAFATAMTLSMHCKKWYVVVPAFAWATGVGYSRLYLGQHYPSDVVAGAAFGTGSAILSEWLTKKIWPKTYKH
jgi:membrane-associated phospholipid phosphatase